MEDEKKEEERGDRGVETNSKAVLSLFTSFQEYLSTDQEIREVRLVPHGSSFANVELAVHKAQQPQL